MSCTLYNTEATQHLVRGILRNTPTTEAGRLTIGRFKDGELAVALKDLPKGRAVLVASTGSADQRMLETLLALDALRNERATRPLLIVPYAGFARQDVPVAGKGAPIKFFMKTLHTAGAHTVLVLDPHSAVTSKSAPRTAVLSAIPLLATALKQYAKNAVVVAPDHGARNRAMQLAALLGGLPTAYITKHRPTPDVSVAKQMTGTSVKGKTVIFIDDIIDTGGTMLNAVRFAKKNGATRVIVAAVHGVFSGNATKTISAECDEIFVTNSLPQIATKKVRIIDCAPVLAAAVRKYARG